jgi:LysM repeat protein
MTAGLSDRRPVRIRRRGRHSSPSQVEKVAQQAGKAAPAVAIAGALVAVPAAQHALAAGAPAAAATASHQTRDASTAAAAKTRKASLDSFATHTVTVAAAKATRHAAASKTTHYQVRSGDTLSAIAERYYHDAGDWQYLYHENDKTVADPNLIYVGESLLVPGTVPADSTLTDYVPRHARTTQTSTLAETAPAKKSDPSRGSGWARSGGSGGGSRSGGGTTVIVQSAPVAGDYGCSALEALWEQAGGNSADAFMAAEIATAESSGNPNAISPTDDYGLWQINASNGDLATLNPLQNAKSAIILSHDGTNWDAWTTYTSGAYYGKC